MARVGRPTLEQNGHAAVKNRILDAAEELFAQHGYAGATAKMIAERAQVTPAMIHYYFGSKQGLLNAVLDRVAQGLEVMAQQIVQTGRPPEERLEIYFNWFFDYIVKHKNVARLTRLGVNGELGQAWLDVSQRVFRPLFRIGQAFLDDGIQNGRLREVDSRHFLAGMYGMIVSYFAQADLLKMLMGADPLSRQALKRHRQCLFQIISRTILV